MRALVQLPDLAVVLLNSDPARGWGDCLQALSRVAHALARVADSDNQKLFDRFAAEGTIEAVVRVCYAVPLLEENETLHLSALSLLSNVAYMHRADLLVTAEVPALLVWLLCEAPASPKVRGYAASTLMNLVAEPGGPEAIKHEQREPLLTALSELARATEHDTEDDAPTRK